MLTYVRTRVRHLGFIDVQEVQRDDMAFMLTPKCVGAFPYSLALSGFAGVKCVGCAGLIPGNDYVMVWALLSKSAGRHFVEITKKVKRVLAKYPAKTFRACVRVGFEEGGRWARMLGFTLVEKNVQLSYYPEGYRVDVYELRKE